MGVAVIAQPPPAIPNVVARLAQISLCTDHKLSDGLSRPIAVPRNVFSAKGGLMKSVASLAFSICMVFLVVVSMLELHRIRFAKSIEKDLMVARSRQYQVSDFDTGCFQYGQQMGTIDWQIPSLILVANKTSANSLQTSARWQDLMKERTQGKPHNTILVKFDEVSLGWSFDQSVQAGDVATVEIRDVARFETCSGLVAAPITFIVNHGRVPMFMLGVPTEDAVRDFRALLQEDESSLDSQASRFVLVGGAESVYANESPASRAAESVPSS